MNIKSIKGLKTPKLLSTFTNREMNNQNNTELVRVVEAEGLEKTQAEIILGGLTSFLEQAKEWEKESKSITVTNVDQVDEMKKARELRLAGKKIRTEAENKRKELKEQYLRGGRVVDSIANLIKAVIVPIEEHLEKQEKYAEIIEQERLAKLYEDRVEKLRPYVDDVNLFNLRDMGEESYDKLLQGCKAAYDARLKAEFEAEQERLLKEQAEKEEQERIKIENERLKEEAKIREAEMELERQEQERVRAEEKAEQEKQLQLEREKLAKEQEAKAEAERKLKEKEEADKKALAEREEMLRKEEEAKAETERQAKLAPEKDKLFAYSEVIRKIESPEGLSKAGLEIVKSAEAKLLAISQEIKESIKNL
jgi:hypothetical protein